MRQKLTQLSEHIWLWPHHKSPNMVQASIGVIAGDDETILVDAGNSPKLARRLKRELHRTGLPPVGRIIYTHHHWDHVWRACVFQVPVIAHASCQTILQEEARKPWSSAYLDQLLAKNPLLKISCTAQKKAIDDWESFHIVVPNTTFEERMTIEPAPLTIELEYVGGQHAQDSIVVKIPQEDLIF